jgi:rhamnulokinase
VREQRYIAFDLGAESGRCVVGTLAAGRFAMNEVHRFPTHRVEANGEIYWDILGQFEEIKSGLSHAAKAFGPAFDGVSVTTWGVDYVLLDGHDRLLGYPYHYRSRRTEGMMDAAFEQVGKEEIYRRTGIQFMPINTIYQLLSEQRRQASLLNVAQSMLLIPDFFLFLLTGEKRAEYTIASTTQLADPHTRDWSWPLIDRLGFPAKLFSSIVEPGTQHGVLRKELAKAAGLETSVPVWTAASHDTAAAVAAVPATGSHWAYLSSGSWSLMGVERVHPIIDDRSLAGNFTNEGGVARTTRILKNISGLWLLQASRAHWLAAGKEYSYAALVEMAEQAGPAEAWVDPNDARFLIPGDMPGRLYGFLEETGQRAGDSIGWLVRCILESLVFKYRQVFLELEALQGHRIERLHVVGGGALNKLMCRMTADALGREVVAGPVEATAVGNVGMQAVASGTLDDVGSLRSAIRRSFEMTTYSPGDGTYWDQHDEAFNRMTRGVKQEVKQEVKQKAS